MACSAPSERALFRQHDPVTAGEHDLAVPAVGAPFIRSGYSTDGGQTGIAGGNQIAGWLRAGDSVRTG
jgi:hypothetical protein